MTRKEIIIASILLVFLGAGMHFVHHAPFFNHFLGYIFPIAESVMAHMKMVFYPMLLLAIYLIIPRPDIKELGAPILGSLAVMPCIIVAFFSYWIFVRHEIMAVDLVIYVLAIIGAILLANRWRKSNYVRDHWPLWIAVAIVVMVVTGFLSYHSPDWIIFADMG